MYLFRVMPIFIGLYVLLSSVLTYSRYKYYVRYTHCKHSSDCILTIHFLSGAFQILVIFDMLPSNLSLLFLMVSDYCPLRYPFLSQAL